MRVSLAAIHDHRERGCTRMQLPRGEHVADGMEERLAAFTVRRLFEETWNFARSDIALR